ncbi:hypothetical protein [uncultured Xanthomonas sp.]|uniref:hypothetical protein n=1 Tax=uncultured Xanthomonas sp. TaxID=152831 RepID=UPI0025D5473E|nr:hypothetical protein [uncultured Xanthomonas sp.]
MKKIIVGAIFLLILAFNCIGIFFAGILGASDGSAELSFKIFKIGYSWVSVVAVLALIQWMRGKQAWALATLSLTLPLGYALSMILFLGQNYLNELRPNTPEFSAACQGVGPRYIGKPKASVKSIAYDWDPAISLPSHNAIGLDKRGNINFEMGGLTKLPSSIEFTEQRCCRSEINSLYQGYPYLRRIGGQQYGIPELSADVVVNYKVTQHLMGDSIPMKTVNITVKDRRDDKLLATLKYVVDEKENRACGAVLKNVIDEQEFIRRAIGMN